jgi:hypothetical protein
MFGDGQVYMNELLSPGNRVLPESLSSPISQDGSAWDSSRNVRGAVALPGLVETGVAGQARDLQIIGISDRALQSAGISALTQLTGGPEIAVFDAGPVQLEGSNLPPIYMFWVGILAPALLLVLRHVREKDEADVH